MRGNQRLFLPMFHGIIRGYEAPVFSVDVCRGDYLCMGDISV